MTACVTFLPVIRQRETCRRMYEFGSNLGQRPQDEAVFENIGTGQLQRRLRDHKIPIEQQVDIEGPCRKPVRTTLAPGHPVNRLYVLMNRHRVIVGLEAHDQVEEVVTVETDCRILVDVGNSQVTVARSMLLPSPR
jgi:hypothetical protein